MKIQINGRCLEGQRTGVGRYLANLLRMWSEKYTQHQYDIFFRKNLSMDPFLDAPNVYSSVIQNSSVFDFGPVWENYYLPRALKKTDNTQLYFSPLYTLPLFPLKTKKVVTIFDISYIAHPEWFPKRQLISLKTLTGPTVRKADMILTGSYATKNEILKYYDVDPKKINITNLGIDKRFLDLEETNYDYLVDSVRRKYKLRGKIVLFIGLIMNRRNLPVVMESISNVMRSSGEEITLVVIGKNHSFPHFDVEYEAESWGVEKNLRWLEYTTDDEVFSFYKAADVFVCSSLYEGFNITPLEALGTGVPVVCSNMSSLPEVVGNAAYMLSDPRDPVEMTAGLEKVLYDSTIRADLIQKGYKQASKFSWERCADETMALFEELV